MTIVNHAEIERHALPGIEHVTVASHRDGVQGLEVWVQTLEPGAVTPPHAHSCEEIVVVLAGTGVLHMNGEESQFGPNTTLIVPAKVVHQISNEDAEPMHLVAAFSRTPPDVLTPDGEPLPVPWL